MISSTVELGSVSEIQIGPFGSLLHKADYIKGGIPVINPMHIAESGISADPAFSVSNEKASGLKRYVLAPGEVIMGRRGEMGRCAVVEQQHAGMLCGTGSMKIIPATEQLSPKYLVHMLRTPKARRELENVASGVTMLNLNAKALAGLKIPLPPLEEQKRIAGILDQADRLRRLRKSALTRLNTLGQSIFHEMFGGAEKRANRLIQLGDWLGFVTSGGRGWAKYYAEEGARFIRSLDVQMNEIGYDDVVFVQPPDNAEAKRTRVEAGDVLLTITGSKIGRAAPVHCELAGSYISQHVAILRPSPERLLPEFLSYFLTMDEFGQRQIKAKQYGQAKPGLNFEQIRSFELPDVSLEQQEAFISRLSQSSYLKSEFASSLKQSETLFTSLQHRAFSGEL